MSDDILDQIRDAIRLDLVDLLDISELRKTVWIDGVEVTQAIQHYRADKHLTDRADRGPDNSVHLVAGKPAWVRVYLRSRSADVADVGGTLAIQRRHAGFLWTDIARLTPQPPGSITARRSPSYSVERASRNSTLNFIIPAALFHGMLRLKVLVVDNTGKELDTDEREIDATLRQTLRVRAILVSYNGPATSTPPPPGSPPVANVTIAAPTIAGLATTAGLALRAMPVQSQGDFATAGTMICTVPLDDARTGNGACSKNWEALLANLTTARINDGNRTDVVYYGLLPTGIPLGVPGCGQGGLGSAVVGDQGTFLHEIGHGYGFQHTPSGNVGTPDPNYPVYEPYPSASIGEYGLDVNDGTVYTPVGTSDYMSYGPTTWMSLYQHERLILHPRLGQESLRDDLPWRRKFRDFDVRRDLPYPPPETLVREDVRMKPVIAISGIVHDPGKIEVVAVARVSVMGDPVGERTNLSARLIGADGADIASATVRRLVLHGDCGCGSNDPTEHLEGPYRFEVYVPDIELGAALVIDNGEERLWERRAASTQPTIGAVRAEISECRLNLSWDTDRGVASSRSKGRQPADTGDEVWAQWSPNEGQTWFGLATGLRGGKAELDASVLRPGMALIRLLRHDGFHTAVSDPVEVQVPVCGVQVAVQHPEDGGLYGAGSPMRLLGVVMFSSGGPVSGEWARWVLDGKEVAQGLDAWIASPGVGDHHLLLHVRTQYGESESAIRFTCEPSPDSPDGRSAC